MQLTPDKLKSSSNKSFSYPNKYLHVEIQKEKKLAIPLRNANEQS